MVDLGLELYRAVGAEADRLGLEAYAVGGVVRDFFLGRPCTDIDFVCLRRDPVVDAPAGESPTIGIELAHAAHRAIGGSNWHSDIVAGRLAGCMALSVVASGSDFLDLLESARVEYDSWHGEIITDSPSIRQDSSQNDKQLYTIDGRPATPNSRGILVGRNRKVLVP